MDLLFKVGFAGALDVADGRVPIGATALPWLGLLPGAPARGGEPPGEDALVRLDCCAAGASNTPLLLGALDWGLALLLVRERWLGPADWDPVPPSTGGWCPASAWSGGVRPYS